MRCTRRWAIWQERAGRVLGLDKLNWTGVSPEYDPYKYSSFTANAGNLAYELTAVNRKKIAALGEAKKLGTFPPVLAFQSVLDATITAPSLVRDLFAWLPANRHELVIFDLTRNAQLAHLLTKDPKPAAIKLLDTPDQIVCVEPSAGMIAESRKTVPCIHYQSTAEKLPVQDESFDFLTMGFALRHVDDLDATFREYRRVLKDGGKALVLDVTIPDSLFGSLIFKAYFKHILPMLTLVFSRNREAYRLMKYYWETMEQMTGHDDVAEIMREAGFRTVTHRVLLGCFSEYEAVR